VVDLETGFTPWKLVPLWQLAQPEVMPAWFIAVPVKVANDLWHVSQLAVVGIWFVALPTAFDPL
jgi:hypothetical protein